MSVRLLIIASYLKEGRFMCKISCSLSCSNLFTHVWNAHTLYISELHATCTDLKRHTKSFDRQTIDNFLLQQTKYNLIKMQRLHFIWFGPYILFLDEFQNRSWFFTFSYCIFPQKSPKTYRDEPYPYLF